MTIAELPDDFTPQQFMQLDKASLDALPYDLYKWNCCCKKCENGTTVRDYGIAPFYFLNRNSKNAESKTDRYWNNLNQFVWFCGKHWKLIRRLEKKYSYGTIAEKLINPSKPKIGLFVKQVNASMEQVNEFKLQ